MSGLPPLIKTDMASYRFKSFGRYQGRVSKIFHSVRMGEIKHDLPEGEFPESIAEDVSADFAPIRKTKKIRKKTVKTAAKDNSKVESR